MAEMDREDYFESAEFKALSQAVEARVMRMVATGEAVENEDGSITILTKCPIKFGEGVTCKSRTNATNMQPTQEIDGLPN